MADDYRLSTLRLPLLRAEADNELDRRYLAAIAAEIERLRAENERLQGLIDGLAAAYHADLRQWWVAVDALVAAARTEEVDRG